MSKQYTVLVLDASGSMGSIRDEAIEAFNEQLKDIRKVAKSEDIHPRIGLVKFGTDVQKIDIWDSPISKVNNLQKKDYRVSGMTAMLDGVGTAIDKLLELDDINDKGTSVLINIISDGEENNSKEYSFETLAAKIKELTATGRWTFTYTGANQDLSVVSERMNIPKGNTLSFTADSHGMKMSNRSRSVATSSYFSGLTEEMARGGTSYSSSGFFASGKKDSKDSKASVKITN